MDYKVYNYETYNLHTIKTSKFKECLIDVTFRDNLDKEEYLKCMLLAEVMQRGTKNYPSKLNLAVKSEELYMANFFPFAYNDGALTIFAFTARFINPKYIKDKKYIIKVLEHFKEIIFNPNINDNLFDDKVIDLSKKAIKVFLKTIPENPMRLASLNARSLLPDNNVVRISNDAYNEADIDKITNKDLVDMYNKIINNYLCDVYVTGELDFESFSAQFNEAFPLKVIKNHTVNPYNNGSWPEKIIKKTDRSNFNQSTIIEIFDTKDLTKYEENIVMKVFNYIFSSGSFKSKLFKSLREDNSLCYSANGISGNTERAYIVTTSLAKENCNQAIKLIKKALKEMNKGIFDDDIIDEAKKMIIRSYKATLDRIIGVSNDYFFHTLTNSNLIEEKILLTEKVTKEDIIEISKKIHLRVQYILEDNA